MCILSAETASAYVAAHFAKYETPVDCEILRTAPCADDDCEHAVDVFFRLSDAPDQISRFTVWVERYPDVAPFLYGEW